MAFISVSGIACAAPTRVLAASIMLLASPLAAKAAPAGRLEVSVGNLRNSSGQVRLCLTRDPRYFPNCKQDPNGRSLSVPAGKAAALAFEDLPPGAYALSVFHDEN